MKKEGSGQDVNSNEPREDDKKDTGKKVAVMESGTMKVKGTGPPDGGYGWIIVLVAFYGNFVVDGICYAFGNFRPVLQEKFPHESEAAIAFVGSSIVGTYLLVGPIASGLVNSFGPRTAVAIGGTVSCLAFLASTIITNIYILILVYGILGGVGFGFIYLPAIVVVCFFFDKKRSLATGIAVAGSGAGSVVMPFIVGLLQDSGFSIICIVQAVFAVSCIFAGMLYKTLDTDEGIPEDPEKDVPTFSATPMSPVVTQLRTRGGLPERPKSHSFSITDDAKAAKEKKNARLSLVSDIADLDFKHMKSEVRDYVQSFSASSSSGRFDSTMLSKPLTRTDAFFGGPFENLQTTDQQNIREDLLKYKKESSRNDNNIGTEKNKQTSQQTVSEGDTEKKAGIFRQYLQLAKEPVLIILLISNTLAMLGFYVPFVFPRDLAIANGIPPEAGKNLVSLIGFSNTIGRLLFGWLNDRKWLTALTLNNVSLVICGFLTVFGPFCITYELILFYSISFGVFGAAYICLTSIILTDWLGLDRLTNAFGILVLGRSVGCFFGTPIAGAIKDFTGGIYWPFYVSGVLLLLGGVSSFMIPLFAKPKGLDVASCKK